MSEISQTIASTGRVVWHELLSTDPEKSMEFYSDLFGWDSIRAEDDVRDGYTTFAYDGREVGGMVPVEAKRGSRSCWNAYITVPSVDVAAMTVRTLGGEIHVEAKELPGIGRFAAIADPSGATLCPFMYASNDAKPPEENGTPPPFGFCWNELHTSELNKCKFFYASIFGWAAAARDLGARGTCWVQRRGDKEEAGMFQTSARESLWVSYVAVDDVQGITEQARNLGGAVLVGPLHVPEFGQYAVIADSCRARVGLVARTDLH